MAGSPIVGPGRARRFDPAATPPEVLYLSLPASDICNYRCRHCHIWMQERRPDALSRDEREGVVRQFAALNPAGTVVLPGGEVTLEPEELFAVAAACRRHGLPLILLTNGSRLRSDAEAEALCDSGVGCVVVSLDGHLPELHDYTRGVPTAFEETTAAIRALAAARRRRSAPITLLTAAVVFDRNLPVLGDYVEFCRGLGVDHVDFQILARTFANRHASRDVFFEKHFWWTAEDKERAKALVGEVLDRYAADPFVVKKPADLGWIQSYIDDPDFRTDSPICGSHERNLLVDASGRASLCFNTAAILDAPFVGSVRESALVDLWSSAKAAEDRQVMDACTLNCGALNCHRRRTGAAAG